MILFKSRTYQLLPKNFAFVCSVGMWIKHKKLNTYKSCMPNNFKTYTLHFVRIQMYGSMFWIN